MEFDLEMENGSIFLQGDTTIDLPGHFIVLPLAVIKNIESHKNVIIACGRKNSDGDVDFMTGTGSMMTISSKDFNLPMGKGVPIDGGKAIAFTQSNPVRLIDSMSLIENAKMMIQS